MMENNIKTTPTIELIRELTSLEREIQINILKYDKCRLELIRRFPSADLDEIEVKIKAKLK